MSFIFGACVPLPNDAVSERRIGASRTYLPAPGGPIKIMRTESELLLEPFDDAFPPVDPSFASSCCTRDSSWCIVSRSASTVSSFMGAIGMFQNGIGRADLAALRSNAKTRGHGRKKNYNRKKYIDGSKLSRRSLRPAGSLALIADLGFPPNGNLSATKG